MKLVESFDVMTIPALEERNLQNYYFDRLFASDTVLHALIEAVGRAVPEGSLFGLLESFALAQAAASERLAEVEEYVTRLEAQVAELSVGADMETVERVASV